MSNKAFYLTTPIYYVNDAPHIGHAYTTVAGDVLTRWHRQRQSDVWYLTGTDEHGQKVMRTALEHGVTPQEWTDKLVAEAWQPVLETLDVRNDDFIRTTDARHMERVQSFIQDLHDRGEIYEGSYEGPYCVGCEEYKLPAELLDGEGEYEGEKVCPIHSRPVEMLKEENYFFRLSAYANRLLDLYEEHPEFVQPASARNEVLQFVRGGLQDLSISRNTFDWGVKVPWDPSHVVYVWFDALLNYVSAVGLGSDEAKDVDLFERTWPADIHLVGKDILRFHAVIWPAMLMAAGLPLPRTVFAHGWLLVGGEKMSKSKLTGIAPNQITDVFGSDAFRYYFMRVIHFGQDGSFSWEGLQARYSADLANGLGNLASRVTAMITKYFDGSLPAPGPLTAAEKDLTATAEAAVRDAEEAIDRIAPHDAISSVWTLVDDTNGYLTDQEPWKVAKNPDEAGPEGRLATILYTAAQSLRSLAVLLNPVMPKACAQLWEQLGGEAIGNLDDQLTASAARLDVLPVGATITKGAALFPRIEEDADS